MGLFLFLPPSATEHFRLQPVFYLDNRKQPSVHGTYWQVPVQSVATFWTQPLQLTNLFMKDWPSELAALRVAPMGNNRGPSNDSDDYLSIFNPSPDALLVRLQVMQHFTMTVASHHVLQIKQKSRFLAKSTNRVFMNSCYICTLF
jgi:hypothetical protein